MPAYELEVVTNSEMLIAGGLVQLDIQPMTAGQLIANISLPTPPDTLFTYGLASVTPYPTIPLQPPRQGGPVPIALPVTTVFIVQEGGGILAAVPSPGTTTTAKQVLTAPDAQENGLAVYQKPAPSYLPYLGPPLPIYLYALCSTTNGETVLRYQMNSDPPYQPAGLNPNNAADPTFVAAGAVPAQGIQILTTYATVQGLACSSDGILAVADGAAIRLFDAITGLYKGTIGVNAVSLGIEPPGNIDNGAFSLAFGPDGCLYVVAGPALADASSVPYAVAILKCSAAMVAQASGAVQQILVPVLTLSANNNNSVGMTVGGTSAAPVVYAVGANNLDEAVIQTYDGNTGNWLGNPFQTNYGQGQLPPIALALVNTYTEKATIEFGPRP